VRRMNYPREHERTREALEEEDGSFEHGEGVQIGCILKVHLRKIDLCG
jgi:hypothetical protein